MGPGWDQVQIASEEKVIFELAGRAAGDCAEPGEFGCSFPATALGQIGRRRMQPLGGFAMSGRRFPPAETIVWLNKHPMSRHGLSARP